MKIADNCGQGGWGGLSFEDVCKCARRAKKIPIECPPLRGFRPDQGGPMPVFSTEEHVKSWFEELDHELEDEI